ncbi:hybrid sensor histidine kinase/response regulator [Teredinibacter waterburyi]|uniref:hybrid sensor histidine kinase/response regulator n=1 Tax=Teredinibacter waterburyi TaxID=1500538 RepID=UPI00165ED7D4|nr:ATP-binding protein [Teredinibacter waterburyi]
MAAKQQIYRVRRNYNQWVNNQTLEDYALRFTAKASRRWSLGRVANTALGAISFLALEAIGAAITLSYGFENAAAAILVVGVLIFAAGLPICYYAAKYGVDIDLLTRGAGFGYIGSTATSLIYASFTFIFFALEAAIMAKALELTLAIPLAIGYVISSIVVIPLVFYGITFISRFQLWTQPIWIALQLLPFIFIFFNDATLYRDWQDYQGTKQTQIGLDILLFGAAASVMFALVAQIGEQVDFLRFLPEKTPENRAKWWTALILAGPGWIVVGCIKMLIGSFLAVVAVKYGSTISDAADPATMYAVAFRFVTDNQHLALALAGIFVVISQLKINVTNAYAGSIAWSNFFSRLTHNHPGRVVWLVFNVAIALLLMELGIYHAFESTLSIYAIVAVSWVGALVADLVLNKPLGLSPKHIEFKRAYLYDVNPVGVGAMLAASSIGILSYLGIFGDHAHALAHFIALLSAFVIAPLLAVITKGKYYIARSPFIFTDKCEDVECSICQNHFETEDMAMCPAYDGYICSLCCSLDARCQDSCKTGLDLGARFIQLTQRWLPDFAADYINLRLLHFVLLLSVVAAVTGILLALIYTNIRTDSLDINLLLEATLWKVFFILTIVAGVICWLFVLAHQSQIVAQEESQTQTRKLVQEIEAHEKTDLKLQMAKEQAEAANNAKSRYLTGISHELRSPLNTVLGYAQLMEMDQSIAESARDKISVIKRSGEHLADLIEGLLDISKIEAGRLEIQRNPIRFKSLLDQLELMFRIQAEDKDLDFVFERLSPIPAAVMGDEKRVRQILINLLSNAVKFTEHGQVKFSISYRNQVAEFKITDTGVGIHEDEFERIFKPFERVRRPGNPAVPGTGLGLTITRLLTDIMGGDISVEPNPEGGCIFTVWLMLSRVDIPRSEYVKPRKIYGYQGERRSIMVVDDDATHRGLIGDLLTPLGFGVVEAPDAESCLDMIEDFTPNIFLIDRRMPGMDGPKLAETLRQIGFQVPIVMVTANANEDILSDDELLLRSKTEIQEAPYNHYLIKPIRLDDLLQSLDKFLNLEWIYESKTADQSYIQASGKNKAASTQFSVAAEQQLPSQKQCENIIELAEIGHLSGLKSIAAELSDTANISPVFVTQFKRYIKEVRFNKIIELVKAIPQ